MNTARRGSSLHQHSGMFHVVWMAGIAAGILVVLLLMGRPLGDAVFLAVALACPLIMIGMMFIMGRGQRQDDGRPKVTDRQ